MSGEKGKVPEGSGLRKARRKSEKSVISQTELKEKKLSRFIPNREYQRFKAGDLFSQLPGYPHFLTRRNSVRKEIFEARIRKDLIITFYLQNHYTSDLRLSVQRVSFAYQSHDPIRDINFPDAFLILSKAEFEKAWNAVIGVLFDDFINPYL